VPSVSDILIFSFFTNEKSFSFVLIVIAVNQLVIKNLILKTMKKSLIIISFVLFAVLMFNSCGSSSSKEKQPATEEVTKVQYTCPMHPEVVSDKPGDCPKCGMALVEKQ